jgi:tetratricopeptide (TPR) repeat protein
MSDALNAGLEALRAGEFAQAEALLAEAARANPNDVKTLMALGAALGELKRWDEAIAAMQQAASLAPGLAAAHYNLGNALEQVGRIEEARQAYRFALQVEPTHQRAGTALRRLMDVAAEPLSPPEPAYPFASAPPAPTTVTGAHDATWALLPEAVPDSSPLAPSESFAPAPAMPPPAGVPLEAQAAGEQAEGAVEPPPGEQPAEMEDEARSRARELMSKPGFQKQEEPPPKPFSEVASEWLVPRLRRAVRPTLILIVLLAVAGLGYGAYYNFLGPGKDAREALKQANVTVREGYKAILAGLMTPDSGRLVGLVPTHLDHQVTEADLKARNQQLKRMAITGEIQVLKIEIERPKGAEEGLPPNEAKATVTVRLSGKGINPVTKVGTQNWRLENGKWAPTQERGNWDVFGDAPVAFDPIAAAPPKHR